MGDTSVILLLYFDHIFVNLSIGKLSEKGIFFFIPFFYCGKVLSTTNI